MLKDTTEIWVVEFAGAHFWIPVGEPWTTLKDALSYAYDMNKTPGEYRVTRFIKPKEYKRKQRLYK